jgi:hypothetical protein
MFKVKRRLTKNLRNGVSASIGPDQSSRNNNINDYGSDNSSGVGAASSTGSLASNPLGKHSRTSEVPLHHTEIDPNGNKSDQSEQNQLQNKNVRFSVVQIREFERILGDNPSCSSGAPIGYVCLVGFLSCFLQLFPNRVSVFITSLVWYCRIGWGYGNEKRESLDKYEDGKNGPRRKQLGLVLTRQAREELLLEWGVSFHDIIDSIRTNVRVKNQRRRTVNAIGTYDRWEEVMENASRKIKRTLFLKKSKKGDLAPYYPMKTIEKNAYEDKDHDATALSSRTHELETEDSHPIDRSTISDKRKSKTSNEYDDDHVGIEIVTVASHTPSMRTDPSRSLDEYSKQQSEQALLDNSPNSAIRLVNTGFGTLPCVDITPNFQFEGQSQQIRTHSDRSKRSTGTDRPVSTLNILKQVLEDPRYMDAMDDPGAFYNYDEMTVSDFSYTEETFFEEGDIEFDGCDEFESLDRDCSHWEVRSSGQNRPVIQRKMTPVVITEDVVFNEDLGDIHWQQHFTMMSPLNSAQIISSWQ